MTPFGMTQRMRKALEKTLKEFKAMSHEELTELAKKHEQPECLCNLRQRCVGDGCQHCNPDHGK